MLLTMIYNSFVKLFKYKKKGIILAGLFPKSLLPVMKTRIKILIAIILFTGLLIRLLVAWQKDFWFDEAFSFFIARNSIKDILIASAAENTPPLYYILLHFWLKIGKTAFFIRLSSLIFNLLSVWLVYRLGKIIYNHKTGFVAALLFLFSPLIIDYAVETRMYSLWIWETLLILILFLRVLEKRRPQNWIMLFGLSVLAMYTHYFTVFLLAALMLFLIIYRSKYQRLIPKFALLFALTAVCFLPWLAMYFRYPHPDFYGLTPIIGLIASLASFVLGGAGQITLKTMFGSDIFPVLRIAWLLLLCIGSVYFSLAITKKTNKHYCQLLKLLVSVPLVMVFMISFVRPVFSPRAMIIFSPAFYLLTADKITKLAKQRLIVILGIVVLIILSIPVAALCHDRLHQEPVKKAAEQIGLDYRPGDIVAHASIFSYYPSRFYHSDKMPEWLVLPTTLTNITMEKIGHRPVPLIDFTPSATRVWFIHLPNRAFPDDILSINDWLNSHLRLIYKYQLNAIEVRLYEAL